MEQQIIVPSEEGENFWEGFIDYLNIICIFNNLCALLNVSNISNIKTEKTNITKKYRKDLCIEHLVLINCSFAIFCVTFAIKKILWGTTDPLLLLKVTRVPKTPFVFLSIPQSLVEWSIRIRADLHIALVIWGRHKFMSRGLHFLVSLLLCQHWKETWK